MNPTRTAELYGYGVPVLVPGLGDTAGAIPLQQVKFAGSDERYNEAWIQALVHTCPEVLPVRQIELAFEDLRAVCRELPMPNRDGNGDGFLDNLLVTPSGNLALIECKLWRNPEARREVVGQTLDYAERLARWSYEDLLAAVQKVRKEKGNCLYRLVAEGNDLDEASFVDAVSRNLRLGRFLLLVVGDGIYEDVAAIAAHLERHSALRFVFGLVQIAVFRLPEDNRSRYLAQPRILAKSLSIPRPVLILEDGRSIVPIAPVTKEPQPAPKTSITEELFYEALGRVDSGSAKALPEFLRKCESLGCLIDRGTASLSIKVIDPEGDPWSLGAVMSDGHVWVSGALVLRDRKTGKGAGLDIWKRSPVSYRGQKYWRVRILPTGRWRKTASPSASPT